MISQRRLTSPRGPGVGLRSGRLQGSGAEGQEEEVEADREGEALGSYAPAVEVDKQNPKAHTFSGGTRSVPAPGQLSRSSLVVKVQKRVQYTLERQAKKDKAPKVDKTPEAPCL